MLATLVPQFGGAARLLRIALGMLLQRSLCNGGCYLRVPVEVRALLELAGGGAEVLRNPRQRDRLVSFLEGVNFGPGRPVRPIPIEHALSADDLGWRALAVFGVVSDGLPAI